LCVLETCGWIEEALDLFYNHHLSRLVIERNDVKEARRRIKKIYSFEYDHHVRMVAEWLVGLRGVEAIERSATQAKFEPMVAALDALKKSRDGLAHTHVVGVQYQVDAPSVTVGRFKTVVCGLHDMERTFRRLFP
jgi:hypothetical protein